MLVREDDPSRNETLRGYGVLDTPNEPDFDAVVREAAKVLGTPIALISLLDENRQWFKAKVGLQASETPLSISFCTHAVRGPDVFQIGDATKDARFKDNPLVTGDPSIRFYAGAPLKTSTGARIGTLCVIDNQPRQPISDDQKTQLSRLADRVMAILEERKRRGLPTRSR